MAKGAYLTPRIKQLIAGVYLKNKAIGPSKAREELLKKMKEEELDKNFGPDFPSVSTVSKQLKECKEKDEERTPETQELDEIWSFGSLAKYPIPSEAIPLVLSIYEKCAMESNCSDDWMPTIREVLWVARLHKIVEFYKPKHVLPDVRDIISDKIWLATGEERQILDKLKAEGKTSNQEIAEALGIEGKEIPLEDIVLEWASKYASYEELSEIDGEPFDSMESQLDADIVRDVYTWYGERRQCFIAQIEEDYGLDAAKLEDLNLSIADIEQVVIRLFESKCENRVFYLPPAEMSKMAKELRELKVGGFRGNLVFLEANNDIHKKLLPKLEKHEVNLKGEVQNER